MRVHHLDCVSMCPPGGRLIDGRPHRDGSAARLSCHCVLLETDRGLVLLDTGFGLADVHAPRPRLARTFLALNRPRLREEDTAVRQVERLGFDAADVRHVVLTHLDFDHAGGLDDFPEATVHLLAAERDVAFAQRTALDRRRFRPRQWGSAGRWVAYATPRGGDRWFGFECVWELEGLPPEILLVPLPGHTLGHAGIAFHDGGRWALHAGDAYFFRGEMAPRPRCTPGLRAYQALMEQDRAARLLNQRRLRALAASHRGEVRVFCAHDAVELEALRAHHGAAAGRAPGDAREAGGAALRSVAPTHLPPDWA
jgi:glyoxylase-like metal-dependent hydrolase (beta-lactamase superfamily II)